jgi:phthiocerol/phenolphthiocerol synthesis type-I polyketide synthase E
VDGIVHGAGLPGGGMAEVRDRAAAEAVLAPKLAGVLALAGVFGADDLDVVALLSSVTAVAGGVGQVDYCAANAVLDAVARGRHGFRCRVVSIDWGAWLDVGMAADSGAGGAAGVVGLPTPVDHPLLTRRRDAGGGRVVVGGTLSPATSWVLAEHLVGGVPVLPGTAYLELAVTAVRTAVPAPPGEPAVELRDVTLTAPLAVPPDGSVEVEVEVKVPVGSGADPASAEFRVASRPDPATVVVHAEGTARWIDAGSAPRHDLAAIRDRCVPAGDGSDVDGPGRDGPGPDGPGADGPGRDGPGRDGPGRNEAGPEEAGRDEPALVTVGPHWPAPTGLYVGAAEQLARLELADVPADGPGGYWLHPALLDRAIAFPRLPAGGGGWLPLGYGRLVARGPMPARVWSHVRYTGGGPSADPAGESAGVLTADVSVLDEDGREVVAVADFLLRRVDRAAAAPAVATAGDEHGEGIRPRDGAEAFARVLGTDLGPQVVVGAVPLDELRARITALTPETVEALDAPTGEVDQTPVLDGAYVAPRTELEATLARIYGEVLGIGRVGILDNFFEMGGNSLLGVQLISQVRKAVGARLPMRALFDLPTVAEIAAKVEELRGAGAAEEPIPRLPR